MPHPLHSDWLISKCMCMVCLCHNETLQHAEYKPVMNKSSSSSSMTSLMTSSQTAKSGSSRAALADGYINKL